MSGTCDGSNGSSDGELDSRIQVRRARWEDLGSILEIYNDAVLHTTASYDEEPRTIGHREQWFKDHELKDYAVFVACSQSGAVVGWSSISPFHDRRGFRFTCENSVYVASNWRGKGIGKLLLTPLLEAARVRGMHVIIAAIDASNPASVRLHERFGFVKVGHFSEVGFKFGRWLDVVYMQKTM